MKVDLKDIMDEDEFYSKNHQVTEDDFYKKSNKKATPCEVAFHDETGSRDGV